MQWFDAKELCEKVISLLGGDITEITSLASHTANPLVVFDVVDIAPNPRRFAVFICWLKHRQCAEEWYKEIRNQRPKLVADAVIGLQTRLLLMIS